MDNINYRGIPTSLFLNGPKLGIVTDPQNQTGVIGVATFTGIATATFPNPTDGVNDGSIEFNWYFDGSQILDTSVDSNSNASIVGFSSATGTGSTITISGLKSEDNGKEVYFTADYIPTAYSQPVGSVVTAGTARSTSNAYNEPLQSDTAIITLAPIIEITSQPEDQIIGETFDASYSIAAKTTPGDGPVEYQWQLDGNDLSDGTSTRTITDSTTGQIEVTNNVDNTVETIDFSQVSSYDKFVTYRTYTLVANANITTKIFATGAGGGASVERSVAGGDGGEVNGEFTFVKDQAYKLIIGEGGDPGTISRLSFSQGGTGGGGIGGESSGGNGGSYTGLFLGSVVQQSTSILIAGAGGGGSNDPATGGAGGGLVGGDAGNAPGRGGEGGTQTAGGAGGDTDDGTAGNDGYELGGGPGAAGGGAGYYGGGGGNVHPVCCADGAGGGGSSFFDPALITNGSTTAGAGGAGGNNRDGRSVIRTAYDGRPEQGAPTYKSVGGDGSFRIELTSIEKTVTTTISGSQTDNLTISSDGTGSGVIRCKVTADNVQKSPVFSRSVSYYVVGIRNVIKIEQYDYTDGTAILSENNLSDGGLSLSYDTHPGNAICLYAGEKDIDVEVDMYGGKGLGETEGANGGEGGYSKIKFTMKKDEEYMLTGLFDAVNAPFLYRKATLIAVVGGGGDRGNNISGGAGGGINIRGDKSGNAGSGGPLFQAGTLPSNGIFGSLTSLTAVSPDTNAAQQVESLNPTLILGGRTIPCTRGVYWRNQGKSPCEDLGTIKFRTPDGTEISNTAEISRGYKSGYNIIQTKGRGGGDSGFQAAGNGGAGATGGGGGSGNVGASGGGGSGYTDGSVDVIRTQLGGSTGPARINIKLSAGDFFIDSEGRILILSISTPNVFALQQQTDAVLPTDIFSCIDDARWQNFLDLARDGTQNYRLTATGWSTLPEEEMRFRKLVLASEFNIHKMMNANRSPLATSLTDWKQDRTTNRYYLAWDEDTGMDATGGDYSLLWYVGSGTGWGYYEHSKNKFFKSIPGTKHSITSAQWWILPPGVPDFP